MIIACHHDDILNNKRNKPLWTISTWLIEVITVDTLTVDSIVT